ncbi:hypothetical protein [Nereida ignava]|jgi:hypothetical protein|uniref:hypothetical protein n=1 Tax=Nereida ignava TaxID=282199 RepID=UPI0030FA3C9B
MMKALKGMGKKFGLWSRLVFAFLGLFAPATMLVCVVKAFLQIVEDLDAEELKQLIEEVKDA